MEISEKQKQKIEEVAKKYHLRLVLLFGSRVDGKIHKESDYDVAYLPSKNLSYDEENYLSLDFIRIFKHDFVDTVDMRKSRPLLLFMVFKKCQILFAEDNLVFPKYKLYAYRKYIEAKPLYEEKFRKLQEKIKNL